MERTAFTRNMERVLYKFKRLWKTPIQIHQVDGEPTTNYDTGEITRNEKTLLIKKALILPRESARKFIYDLAYIASAKNFTEGAYFDSSIRHVVIDRKDLPLNVEIHIDDEVTIDSERYQITNHNELPYRVGYLLICRRTKSGDRKNDSY